MKKIEYTEFLKWEDDLKKTDILLDIGCWSGERILELNKKCNCYGMDINKEKLLLAKKEIKKKLRYGDVTKKIPFKQKFDWIILSEVLEHVSDDEKVLKNISNSLKLGGKLILTTPRLIKYFEFWDPAWFRWKFLGGQRHYHYTKRELYEKLKKAGFIIEEIRLTGNIKWLFFRWVNTILKNISRIKKSYHCEKNNGFFDWEVLAKKNER